MCLDGERKDRLKADTPATLLLRFLWKHKRNNKGSSRCRISTFQIIYLFITCVGSYFVPHTSNLFWSWNVWLLMHFLNIGSVCHHKLLNLKQLTKPQSVGGVEQNYCMNFSAIIAFFFLYTICHLCPPTYWCIILCVHSLFHQWDCIRSANLCP